MHEPHQLEVLLDRAAVARFTVAPPVGHRDFERVDGHLKARVRVAAGSHRVGVTFLKLPSRLLETGRQPYQARFNMHRHPRRAPAVYQVSIHGPLDPSEPGDTPSRRRIFEVRPATHSPADEERCAEQIVGTLMRRACRRPVTAADLTGPLGFYRRARDEAGFESLVRNFAGQWLHLRNLDGFSPDLRLFPDFDDNLRQAFRRETELLFEHVLRGGGGVLDLIDSEATFLNERLARETSNRTYPEIGVSDPHHPLTHHGNDPDKVARMAKINAFHVSLFAGFVAKLDATRDGDGSLLDHSLLLYGSGMGNPNLHDHTNLPVLVAGGASVGFKGGRHLRFDRPTPLANLHLTLLHKAGVPLESFADSQGRVDQLFEPLSV